MKRMHFAVAALCVAGLLSAQLVAQEDGQKKTIVTYAGKVKSFERMDPAMVVITTDKGEINAELAPMTFVEENKLEFAPEDEITLKGYEKTKDGKTTLVVTEVTTKDKRVVKLRGDDFNPVWAKVTTANGHGEKIVTYSGKVKSFEKMDPAMVFITTDKGDIQAELAPMTFIEENKLLFAPDDMIVVKGFEKMRDGKRLFVVTEVTTKDKRVVKLRNDARTPVWVKVDRPTETRDLTGAVTVVETMDTPDGRLVTIKTDTGEQVIALGPGTYLEKHRYVLTPGERIVVKGYEVNRGGKRVFLALNVKKGDAIWKFRRDDGTILWE